jgi:hypothetical protein
MSVSTLAILCLGHRGIVSKRKYTCLQGGSPQWNRQFLLQEENHNAPPVESPISVIGESSCGQVDFLLDTRPL